ncbi:MAG: hypothetical protein JOY77_09615 [Alphaproteobacteria bacterium]|nr:hypothetical protein [Alphaproteobacteria bacterium]
MHHITYLPSLAAVFGLFSSAAQADFSLSKKPTHDVSCSAGVCMPTAKSANLNVSELTNMLSAGDVIIESGNGNQTTPSITVADAFGWSSTSRLTLQAKKDIAVKAPMTVAGTGALTLTYSDSGTDGDLKFLDKGKIDFWDTSSSLIINNSRYVLINDLRILDDAVKDDPSGMYAFSEDHDALLDGSYNRSPVSTGLQGVIEGLGHTISNLSVKTKRPAALVAQSSGTIRDLLLLNVFIKSHGGSAGGIVADNSGLLIGDTANGKILRLGNGPAGGIAGTNTGTIFRCDSSGTVAGSPAGGIVGSLSSGVLEASASSANVSG